MSRLTMMERYSTISGTSCGFDTQTESINSPNAPPRGFARVANAVALMRPRSENHRSLYLVGALRQNGCASPMRIWPNMARPNMPPFALVPAYRIQFPTSTRMDVVMMAGLGPPLFRVSMTSLDCLIEVNLQSLTYSIQ